MSIAILSQTTVTDDSVDTGMSGSHTVDAGTTVLLALFKKGQEDGLTDVSWNGVAMTEITSAPTSGTPRKKVWAYYLINPTAGTGNFSVTSSTATTGTAICYNLSGTDSDPIGGFASFGQSTGNPTIDVTLEKNNSWLFGVIMYLNAPQDPTIESGTDDFESDMATGGEEATVQFSHRENLASGSQTIAWDPDVNPGSGLAVEIIETQSFRSPGGGVAYTPTMMY